MDRRPNSNNVSHIVGDTNARNSVPRETSRSASSSGERELYAIFSGLRVVSMAKKDVGQVARVGQGGNSTLTGTMGATARAGTSLNAVTSQHFEGEGNVA